MDGGGVECVQARVEQVTTNIDVVDILGPANETNVAHVRSCTAIRTARHPYADRLIYQAKGTKVGLYLSNHRRKYTLSLSQCQSTGGECWTGHGKATCTYSGWIGRYAIAGKQGCQWAALFFAQISKENVLLGSQANARAKLFDSVTQTRTQTKRLIVFHTPVLNVEAQKPAAIS